MDLQIKLKRLGKKKVHTVQAQIDDVPKTLKALIESCVRGEVGRYNKERQAAPLLHFLSPNDIAYQAEAGKVNFADINNKTLADQEQAIEDALLAFTDGLFVVFMDDEELTTLDTPLTLKQNSEVTFIRMIFLSGSMW